MNIVYIIIALWAVVAFSTTLTVIILRTREVKKVVKNAVENLEGRVDAGLSQMETKVANSLEGFRAETRASVASLDRSVSEKLGAFSIPEIPDNLEGALKEIYDAIPGEEDWEALAGNITGALAQQLASAEGVRQKAIYEFMNQNEEAFAGLDAETQAMAVSKMDLTSMALQEIANLKMSPTQARKTPLMAMGLNLGKAGVAQMLMGIRQQQMGAVAGQGKVMIEGGGGGSYSPGFNP
jgi:hypothetical protein